MKIQFLVCSLLTTVLSCQSKQQATEAVSSIDSTLQTSATAILESKLSELNAQSGQVIVMEVQSGQIKALVGLERKDSAELPTMRELLCTTAYWLDAGCLAIGCTGNWKGENE